MYKLFIDDERWPVTDDWVLVRSSTDAIYCVHNKGIPNEIAFDHDLGGTDTSMVFIRHLIDHMLDNQLKFPIDFKYSVHSQNPVGSANIKALMNSLIAELN